ncbi:MAG: hypothetical protein Q8M18_07625 [Bradyrhizobium sp.]|nr:hypothetical protein [Bradyrhizobium sp.]
MTNAQSLLVQLCTLPKIVYLDSSDFSDLSAAESNLSNDSRTVLAALRASVANGTAKCLLSGIHLSEAVHATDNPLHKQAAVRRASLMQELCCHNFVRLPHEVMRLELEKAISGRSDGRLSEEELFSAKSEWFGLSITPQLNRRRGLATAELEKQIAHFPRNKRRKLKSEWRLSNESGRARWRSLLQRNQAPQEFPFNLLSNQFVMDWLVGDRSDDDFHARLIEILNDPKGLVECVLDLTDERDTIYGLLRNQGVQIFSSIEASLQSVLEAAGGLIDLGHNEAVAKALRQAIQPTELRRTLVSQLAETSVENFDDREISRLIATCPSVSVFLNMYVAYAHSVVESNLQRWRSGKRSVVAREPSDFGDMMHAVYAPYCDMFRCDAYFASLLKQDANIKHRVVDRRKLCSLYSP